MKRSPKKSIRFTLSEDDACVRVLLAMDGKPILDLEHEQVPPVVVRHPIARAEELLGHAQYFVKRNPEMGDETAWFKVYIASREKDLLTEIVTIRKALHKIARIMDNANKAKKLMRGLAGERKRK